MNLIIAGAPASGKGTQCAFLKEKFGLLHLSTGDMLREAVSNKTDLGLKANEYMVKGELVPDELVLSLIKEKLNSEEVKKKRIFT